MKRLRKFLSGLLGEKKDIRDIHFSGVQSPTVDDGYYDNYLFDFKNYSSGYFSGGIAMSSEGMVDGIEEMKKVKIKVKPIDVLNELETIPTPFSVNLIDEKLEILKDKRDLINQSYAKREIEALMERLENRKKYIENKTFFDNFQNTTDEKIDVLLGKYDLLMKTSDIFVPEFPDDAIKVMKDYSDKMMEICNKRPIFYVIATEDKFRKAYEKRDPILLVQSPFGFYWQILGAWDKEMILLSEL